jgi:hypothetical protein
MKNSVDFNITHTEQPGVGGMPNIPRSISGTSVFVHPATMDIYVLKLRGNKIRHPGMEVRLAAHVND